MQNLKLVLLRAMAWSWLGVGLAGAAQQDGMPPGKEEVAVVSPQEQAELRKAGDVFMKLFSASLTIREYTAAFRGLYEEMRMESALAETKARELAETVRSGHAALEDEFGAVIPGGFVYVGSRWVGSGVLKLAYWRKYRLGALPVVLVFSKRGPQWSIDGFAIGNAAAGQELLTLWVPDAPVLLERRLPGFSPLRAVTGAFMKALTEGKSRMAVETLVEACAPAEFPAERFIGDMVEALEKRPEGSGASEGYELTGTARQGELLCKFTYLWRFENIRVPVSLEFYKPEDRWLLWRVQLFDNARADLLSTTVTEPAP